MHAKPECDEEGGLKNKDGEGWMTKQGGKGIRWRVQFYARTGTGRERPQEGKKGNTEEGEKC